MYMNIVISKYASNHYHSPDPGNKYSYIRMFLCYELWPGCSCDEVPNVIPESLRLL